MFCEAKAKNVSKYVNTFRNIIGLFALLIKNYGQKCF